MRNKRQKSRKLIFAFILTLLIFTLIAPASCTPEATKQKVVFGDATWDTQRFVTHVAGYIVEHGYEYEVEYTAAKNVFIVEAIQLGDIDIHMEIAKVSLKEPLQKLLDSGQGEVIGNTGWPLWQGWLVPTYMIKGDPQRGIEASVPDLKSVFDMPKYWELFKDPEDSSKGRFYGCIPGWQCEKTNTLKLEAYGLDQYYNHLYPGSDAALAASLTGAYEKGEPWFGYYWSPTWILAVVDMTPLEEPAFDESLWNEEAKYASAYPIDENLIVANVNLRNKAPDVVEFLGVFSVSPEQINEALLYMKDNDVEGPEAANWFLREYEAAWTKWVSLDVADKVKKALSG